MTPADISSLILFSDPSILVVNKPAGMLSLQDGYDKNLPHLVNILTPDYGFLMVVHRLDKETSGVLILARTPEAHRNLNIQFQQRLIEKKYHAIVIGKPSWNRISVNQPLRKNGDRQHRTVIDPKFGKKATTEFSVVEDFINYCQVEAHPLTGYTHQIRAHLAHLRHPIVLDRLYGDGERITYPLSSGRHLIQSNSISRLALHAYSISFTHPATLEKVSFIAPEPQDFSDAIKDLRYYQTTQFMDEKLTG